MPCEGRLHCDLGCIQIPDLAHHDDVRVVAQQRTKNIGEAKANALLHLYLVDSVELIFDRVLNGEDLAFQGIKTDQGGIESRRLAAAGGPGDQYNTMRPLESLDEGIEIATRETKRSEIELRSEEHTSELQSLAYLVC